MEYCTIRWGPRQKECETTRAPKSVARCKLTQTEKVFSSLAERFGGVAFSKVTLVLVPKFALSFSEVAFSYGSQ